MIDANDRFIPGERFPLCTRVGKIGWGGHRYTAPRSIFPRFSRKGCNEASQASEREVCYGGGCNSPFGELATRVNGGCDK